MVKKPVRRRKTKVAVKNYRSAAADTYVDPEDEDGAVEVTNTYLLRLIVELEKRVKELEASW